MYVDFSCLVGDLDLDQVLPRWLYQGAGELTVEVSQTFRCASFQYFL